jgi:site-specific DNA recombinase
MRKQTHDRSAKGRPGVRCAVYTRKSSEEGLEQDFNSLDAQREACDSRARTEPTSAYRR